MMAVLVRLAVLGIVLFALQIPVAGGLLIGPIFDPMDGVWSTARIARGHQSGEMAIDGMDAVVNVRFDERGVPHIFAESDKDATIALGYIVARDRLFEMDFIHRVTTGTLAELMGPGAIATDQHFIRLGIPQAVRRNTVILAEQLPRDAEAVSWYALGANAYLSELDDSHYPLEYRLLGAEPPETFSADFTLSLFAYMAYDLSYKSSDIGLEQIRAEIGRESFSELYPRFSNWENPIVPPEDSRWEEGQAAARERFVDRVPGSFLEEWPSSREAIAGDSFDTRDRLSPLVPFSEGYVEGKGSNNWAVSGSRSTTGMPILAGDMHLALSLPAIWYEAHIVTPQTNIYGVTFPAVPAIVEGITPTTAWTFTNTGSDQIDYYRVQLDESRTQYLFDDEWVELSLSIDTIRVRGADPVLETVRYSHHGPILEREDADYAVKWVGHEFGSTFAALWDMNRATNYQEFEMATRMWDYPMQNILYAGRDSIVAIRSTGYLPVRASGNAFGVLDGRTSDTDWIGRVPFDELPHSILPSRGFLTSTNQRPASQGYPHYLGQDWRSIYRSIRIEQLLEEKTLHSPEDLASYQADVKAIQASLFLPHIRTLDGLSDAGQRMQTALVEFDGVMSLDRTEPRLFGWFMDALTDLMWDEPVFRLGSNPKEIRILDLLASDPHSRWFDLISTPELEAAEDIFKMALDRSGERWKEEGYEELPLRDHQTLTVRHLTRSAALRPLWREGFPFAGYNETLSPARSNPVTWSASWRVIVDFSTSPPKAKGIYPGGQSGNPMSVNYDAHMQKYVDFEYYDLDLSTSSER